MTLYVYYRVRGEHAREALQCALRLQARVAERLGIEGELQKRPGHGESGVETWLEIYPDASPTALAVLGAELEASGLARWIDGERRVEHFVPIEAEG